MSIFSLLLNFIYWNQYFHQHPSGLCTVRLTPGMIWFFTYCTHIQHVIHVHLTLHTCASYKHAHLAKDLYIQPDTSLHPDQNPLFVSQQFFKHWSFFANALIVCVCVYVIQICIIYVHAHLWIYQRINLVLFSRFAPFWMITCVSPASPSTAAVPITRLLEEGNLHIIIAQSDVVCSSLQRIFSPILDIILAVGA
jgi:hypothetical protein